MASNSHIVLNAKTRNIMVTATPDGTSQVNSVTNGTLTIVGGVPAYIQALIEEHNLNNHAHPKLWYVFEQGVASDTWEIQHNLNRFPTVTIVDSGENVVTGAITYIDSNNVLIKFNGAFKGKAYLN